MASTYSTNLAIELIGTGDQAGTWGNTTNTNLGTLIEQAISGYVTQAVSTGTDTTITIPNGATGVARNMYIELTGTGGTNTNLIVPANKKLYFIFNNTSSGQVTVKVSGQTGVSVPNKAKVILVSNGTDVIDATNYIGSAVIGNITATSGTITTLASTSAIITTLSSGSANITQLNSTSGTISTLASTSAAVTTISGTTLTYSSASITNLTATSLVLSNLSIASANITTLTAGSATITTLISTNQATIDGMAVGQGGGNVATNTAVGVSALAANTTGIRNVAVGSSALILNQDGQQNIAIGDLALTSNVSGGRNIGIGASALAANTGSFNTGVGASALAANTTGEYNAGFGRSALAANTTGNYNTAVGALALQANTTASNNTAVGYQAGYSTTTGAENTFIGAYAGYTGTTAERNTFIGQNAGYFTTGSYNTFIGRQANGNGAGQSVTTGTKNVIIGGYNGNQGGLDIRTSSNYIVLSDGDGNPRIQVTNTGTFLIPQTYNDTTANAANMEIDANGVVRRSTSSLRYKTDVQNATHGLADILKLRSVTYKGKNDGDKVFGGLIAEEVHDAGLTEFVVYDKNGQPDALAYGNMVSVLVKAIQELKAEFDAYKASHP